MRLITNVSCEAPQTIQDGQTLNMSIRADVQLLLNRVRRKEKNINSRNIYTIHIDV